MNSKINFLYILLAACCYCVISNPAKKGWDDDDVVPFYSSENLNVGKEKTKQIAEYLSNYGYTTTYTENKKDLRESIKDFQYFAGLVTTGELDSNTEALMQKTRCGIKDPEVRSKRLGRGARFRRYTIQGSKWMKEVITWRYVHNKYSNNAWRSNNPRGLREAGVKYVLRKAMHMWEERTNIRFEEDNSAATPDVWILFVSYQHNDPFRFDGRGGTLAHAFYPMNNVGLAGDVHFDDSERFSIGGGDGKDLMWVAVHELGHTLGLDHSRVQEAIMYPFYLGYKKDIELKYDDIIGIQNIYGGKLRTKKPKKYIPKHKQCPRGKVTAVWDFNQVDSYIMITQDQRLYTVSKSGRGMMHAHIEAKNYYRIKYGIDAVLQTDLGKAGGPVHDYVFTRGGYYVYKGFQQISGPHSFYDGKDSTGPLKLNFPRHVRSIDAAMKWWPNNKVYFFAGYEYWRYDEKNKKIDGTYPKVITREWNGLPPTVDSAYSSLERNITFFTRGDKIYRIKERPRPLRVLPGYPKSIKKEVLKCEEE